MCFLLSLGQWEKEGSNRKHQGQEGYSKPPLCSANRHLPPYSQGVLFTTMHRSRSWDFYLWLNNWGNPILSYLQMEWFYIQPPLLRQPHRQYPCLGKERYLPQLIFPFAPVDFIFLSAAKLKSSPPEILHPCWHLWAGGSCHLQTSLEKSHKQREYRSSGKAGSLDLMS